MSVTNDSSGAHAVDCRREIVLTRDQAAAAQVRYEAFVAEYEASRTTPSGPLDYWTYKALWARAHGADQIRVVD